MQKHEVSATQWTSDGSGHSDIVATFSGYMEKFSFIKEHHFNTKVLSVQPELNNCYIPTAVYKPQQTHFKLPLPYILTHMLAI